MFIISEIPRHLPPGTSKMQCFFLHPNVHRVERREPPHWKYSKKWWSLELTLIFQSWKMYFDMMTFPHPETNSKSTWKWMVGILRLVSFWVSAYFQELVSGSVFIWCFSLRKWYVFPAQCVVHVSKKQVDDCETVRDRAHRLGEKGNGWTCGPGCWSGYSK